jgi:hypothetical protein
LSVQSTDYTDYTDYTDCCADRANGRHAGANWQLQRSTVH